MTTIEKLVIATRNPGKADYYGEVFKTIADEVVDLSSLNIKGKPNENGDTAEQNAIIKALFYGSKTPYPVFCIDEALYVDFLPQEFQPATHVRRINGNDEVTDEELLNYWEEQIKNVSPDKRTGYWHFAYALYLNGVVKTTSVDKAIKFFYPSSQIRIPGWPMSSLQGPIENNKPHSEFTEEEKLESINNTSPLVLKILQELLESA